MDVLDTLWSEPPHTQVHTSINPSQRLQSYGICTFRWPFKILPDPQRTSERSAVQGNGQERLRGTKMTSPRSHSLYTAVSVIRSLPPPIFFWHGWQNRHEYRDATGVPGRTVRLYTTPHLPLLPPSSLMHSAHSGNYIKDAITKLKGKDLRKGERVRRRVERTKKVLKKKEKGKKKREFLFQVF